MEREDAKDLTLSILVIAAILLVADCAWLHVKCSRQCDALDAQSAAIAAQVEAIQALNAKLEAHVNPPAEPSMVDKARTAYENAKSSMVEQYERVKAAAAAGYNAAKAEYNKD